jgi:hypothetical protein
VNERNLRIAGWVGCVVALATAGVISGAAHDEGSPVGSAIEGVIFPLLVAWLVWAFVQRVLRRRPVGEPLIVAAIALVFGMFTMQGAVAGEEAERERAQVKQMACLPESRLYGTPPAGLTYTPLEGAEALDLLKRIEFDVPGPERVDVVFVEGESDADAAILLGLPMTKREGHLDEFEDGVRAEGVPVRRERTSGREVIFYERTNGSPSAAAMKGCHLVMLIGETHAGLRRLAPAVFAP